MIWLQGKAIIEALLFVSDGPLPLKRIAEVVGLDEVTAREIIDALKKDFQQPGRGLVLKEAAGGFVLATRPEVADFVEKLLTPRGTGLSHAALETLAIIAYKQPVTQREIEQIRGVSVDSSLSTLVERRLVREMGRKDAPGRPVLYGTTKDFLLYFGLRDIGDLPPLGEEPEPLQEPPAAGEVGSS